MESLWLLELVSEIGETGGTAGAGDAFVMGEVGADEVRGRTRESVSAALGARSQAR